MQRRKLIALTLIFFCCCLFVNSKGFAQELEPISIYLNGVEVSQAKPYITVIDQSVYIPLRIVAEAIGATVEWHAEEAKIDVLHPQHRLTIWLNENKVGLDDQEFNVTWQPYVKAGVTYIPVRFFAESFGMNVGWIQATRQVQLSNEEIVLMKQERVQATEEERQWLAKLIEAEASGEPLEGKIAVGAVVLNRVQSNLFPNTIKEVIFQKESGYYQFTPVANEYIYEVNPSPDSILAAEKALLGEDPSKGALYFYNPQTSSSTWLQSRQVSTEIGSHRFTY